MRNFLFASAAAIGIALAGAAAAQDKPEPWLPTLQTKTPEEGFALAIELSRKAVTTTQTEKTVLFTLRENYAHDPNSLIAASHVVAINFQTIAAANDYWRSGPKVSSAQQ